MHLRAFERGAQAYEPVQSVLGPTLPAEVDADLEQGAMGGLHRPTPAKQPALAEPAVAQARLVGTQEGSELCRQRGRRARQGGHGMFHGRALPGPEAGVLGRQPPGGRTDGLGRGGEFFGAVIEVQDVCGRGSVLVASSEPTGPRP